MKLYGYWRSTSSWRVRIALQLKGLAVEYVPVHLIREGGQQHESSFASKSPAHQVPVLEVDGAFITQSLAIIDYLEEAHPTPPLLPQDLVLRAKCRALAELVNSGIQPMQNLSVQRYVKNQLAGDEKAWTRHFIHQGLVALDELARQTAGGFLVGDDVSLADICLVPQLYAARRNDVPLDAFSTLLRAEESCARLPAFAGAHPDAQPDKET